MLLEFIPLIMFAVIFVVLLAGYPVAPTLAGTALLFAFVGISTGHISQGLLYATPSRIWGIMTNITLLAVPLFVFMGIVLEKSKLAEQLLEAMALAMAGVRGGLAISVTLVGMLLAASTGIVGATVVTMGLMSLPSMLKHRYDSAFATGTICATGTLGQIIPPSIALVLLGDVLSNAYQQAQRGAFSPKTVSVGDLFMGAVIPGLILVAFYVVYIYIKATLQPQLVPSVNKQELLKSLPAGATVTGTLIKSLLPPLLLIVAVLGSILTGKATPTEAAGVGAFGALILALIKRQLNLKQLKQASQSAMDVTAMVFFILIGATLFSLVFRLFGGDILIENFFLNLPGGVVAATALVMLVIFLLGFMLDFIEITFLVIPIVGPVLLKMGIDPVWLGVMIAINLQTSFLTPPFGFALFYLRGVAPNSIATTQIYKGVVPYILILLALMVLLVFWPGLATWLPSQVYR